MELRGATARAVEGCLATVPALRRESWGWGFFTLEGWGEVERWMFCFFLFLKVGVLDFACLVIGVGRFFLLVASGVTFVFVFLGVFHVPSFCCVFQPNLPSLSRKKQLSKQFFANKFVENSPLNKKTHKGWPHPKRFFYMPKHACWRLSLVGEQCTQWLGLHPCWWHGSWKDSAGWIFVD